MQISTIAIQEKVYSDFASTYRAFGGFIDSGDLWDLCMKTTQDATLMNHIIFCNDIHRLPPVHTFLKVEEGRIAGELTKLEKRSLGAFWGFVFKFVLGYERQKSVTARVNSVKTATYFFEPQNRVEVIST